MAKAEEFEDRLRYLMMLADFSKDEPHIEACILKEIVDLYYEKSIRPPEQIREFLKEETSRIKILLPKLIEQKKKEYMQLTNITPEPTAVQKKSEPPQKIFSDEDIERFKR